MLMRCTLISTGLPVVRRRVAAAARGELPPCDSGPRVRGRRGRIFHSALFYLWNRFRPGDSHSRPADETEISPESRHAISGNAQVGGPTLRQCLHPLTRSACHSVHQPHKKLPAQPLNIIFCLFTYKSLAETSSTGSCRQRSSTVFFFLLSPFNKLKNV